MWLNSAIISINSLWIHNSSFDLFNLFILLQFSMHITFLYFISLELFMRFVIICDMIWCQWIYIVLTIYWCEISIKTFQNEIVSFFYFALCLFVSFFYGMVFGNNLYHLSMVFWFSIFLHANEWKEENQLTHTHIYSSTRQSAVHIFAQKWIRITAILCSSSSIFIYYSIFLFCCHFY